MSSSERMSMAFKKTSSIRVFSLAGWGRWRGRGERGEGERGRREGEGEGGEGEGGEKGR